MAGTTSDCYIEEHHNNIDGGNARRRTLGGAGRGAGDTGGNGGIGGDDGNTSGNSGY